MLEGLKQKGPESNGTAHHTMVLVSWGSEVPIPIVPWKQIVMVSAAV